MNLTKRFVIPLLLLLSLFAFTACGGGGGDSTNLFNEVEPTDSNARAVLSITANDIDGYWYLSSDDLSEDLLAYRELEFSMKYEFMMKIDSQNKTLVVAVRCTKGENKVVVSASTQYTEVSENKMTYDSELKDSKKLGEDRICEIDSAKGEEMTYFFDAKTLFIQAEELKGMEELEGLAVAFTKVSDLK